MKEQELIKTISEYLAIKKKFFWRQNSGAVVLENKGKKRFVRYGVTGAPDIFVLHEGTLFGLEAKVGKNKQQQSQKDFETGFTKAGGIYKVVRSLDEVMETIK